MDLLEVYGIKLLVDIRTIPKSQYNPQFNREDLKKFLKKNKIGYRHLAKLGGLRHAKKDSPNTGWKNKSFRGYADYMATAEFQAGIEQLEHLAGKKKAAIMCAEAVPWRCHRSLAADALVKRGWKVFHIQSRKTASRHKLTPFLKMRRGVPTYP